MPDSTTLEMPGSSDGGNKIPQGVMIIGAIAGVVGLILLLKNSGGGGGTTAAGTSINAALGSIQEENMNLLGVTQAGFMQTNQGLTTGFMNTQSQIGGLGTQIGAGFTNTNGILATMEHDLSAQMTAFSDQTNTNYTNLMGLVASGQASQDQINQQHTALLQSIQQDVSAGLVGQQQANSMLANVDQNVHGMQNFLGWEFYQIPNRYAAYIPWQGPGSGYTGGPVGSL